MRALPPAIRQSFERQAISCNGLGSPFTAALCDLAAAHGLPEGRTAERVADWENPGDDALALRLTGALHNLVLSGRDPRLAEGYPPNKTSEEALTETVMGAIRRHDEYIAQFLASAPQTNETARSAALLPVFLALRARFGLPFVLSEIGSSAGLNQNWHRFRYDFGDWQWGDPGSPVTISPAWDGPAPDYQGAVTVAETGGCDIAPIPIAESGDRLRLKSYVWPDQPARLQRLDGALEIASLHPPRVEQANAAEWLSARLAQRRDGAIHAVFHTIMWQYMPQADRDHIRSAIAEAGLLASESAPLAWVSVEPDQEPGSAAISLAIWCGSEIDGQKIPLGRADFHGRWIRWFGVPEAVDGLSSK